MHLDCVREVCCFCSRSHCKAHSPQSVDCGIQIIWSTYTASAPV